MENMTVANFIRQQIAICGKTQKTISTECGYQNPNIITMFKNGATKLPFNKISAMARALNTDPRYLLRLVVSEYDPEVWAVIVQIMGPSVSYTDDEAALIELARATGYGRTPCLKVPENRTDLTNAIKRSVQRDDARDTAAVARNESLPRNARQL